MRRIKRGLLLFSIPFSLQAQESKIYDYFHPEYEDPNRKSTATAPNKDHYFSYDAALERGIFSPLDNGGLSGGSVTTLQGSCFLNNRFGLRSGVSCISELGGSDKYWKLPFLFAFRTGSDTSNAYDRTEDDTFREYLFNWLLHVLPKRFEFNTGLSFGYITPEGAGYNPKETALPPLETSDIRRRFAFSSEANIRMTVPIGRFGLYVNLGVSYLWTKNYIHTVYKPYPDEFRSAWFANLAIGASFQF
jgi:hypothetical protein